MVSIWSIAEGCRVGDSDAVSDADADAGGSTSWLLDVRRAFEPVLADLLRSIILRIRVSSDTRCNTGIASAAAPVASSLFGGLVEPIMEAKGAWLLGSIAGPRNMQMLASLAETRWYKIE